MTRKFLLCFPLRSGNIVFGFIIVCISIAVVIFHFYRLALTVVSKDEDLEDRFRNFAQLETIFGNDSEKNDLVVMVTIFYYLSYIIVGMLLLIFSTMLTCGACKVDKCLVTTFFVYSFLHIFLTAGLIAWEILTSGWLQLGLILGSNLLLIICLFSVKYLMEAINAGNIYSQPDAVTYYRY